MRKGIWKRTQNKLIALGLLLLLLGGAVLYSPQRLCAQAPPLLGCYDKDTLYVLDSDLDTLFRSHVLYNPDIYAEGLLRMRRMQTLPDSSLQAEWVWVDRSGRVQLVLPETETGLFFSQGRMRVHCVEAQTYGFVNDKGKWTIPCQYGQAGHYAEGLVWVLDEAGKHPGMQYLNAKGKTKLRVPYAHVGAFRQGIARVQTAAGRVGFVNTKGGWVVDTLLIAATDFSHGYALGCTPGGCGLLAHTGAWAIRPEYAGIGQPALGLVPVKVGTRWGYATLSGELAISAQYEAAMPFAHNLAAVKVEGQWGYINSGGSMVIQPRSDFSGLPFGPNVLLQPKGKHLSLWEKTGSPLAHAISECECQMILQGQDSEASVDPRGVVLELAE